MASQQIEGPKSEQFTVAIQSFGGGRSDRSTRRVSLVSESSKERNEESKRRYQKGFYERPVFPAPLHIMS